MHDRIQIHDQNPKKTSIISADQWVQYTRGWFLSEPYSAEKNLSDDFIFEEVDNFIGGLIQTCNHGEWKDGQERWITAKTQKKTLIQESTHFQMILELYPLIHSLSWERYKEEILENEEHMFGRTYNILYAVGCLKNTQIIILMVS